MRHVLTLARRELQATLATTTGWLVLTGFLLVAGVFFIGMLDHYQVTMADQVYNPYAAQRMTLTHGLLAPWFGNLTVLLLVVCPALTMRLIAEERASHTFELLATSPVPTWAVVVGKYLGTMAFLSLMLLATAWMPLSLLRWGSPDLGVIAGGYLATLLLGSTLTALGLLASALTDRQLVALVLGFAGAMSVWVVGWLDPDPTSVASQLSLSAHLQELLRGGLRISDVAYFVLFTAWALFAAHQRVEAFRYT